MPYTVNTKWVNKWVARILLLLIVLSVPGAVFLFVGSEAALNVLAAYGLILTLGVTLYTLVALVTAAFPPKK